MKILLSTFPMLFLGSSCAWMFQEDPHPHLTEVQMRQQGYVKISERKVIEPTAVKPSITEPSNSYPTAVVIPGRPGMVFSPYNNRVIDCIGMRSGSLVMDPQYPREEKKWFIVP